MANRKWIKVCEDCKEFMKYTETEHKNCKGDVKDGKSN